MCSKESIRLLPKAAVAGADSPYGECCHMDNRGGYRHCHCWHGLRIGAVKLSSENRTYRDTERAVDDIKIVSGVVWRGVKE